MKIKTKTTKDEEWQELHISFGSVIKIYLAGWLGITGAMVAAALILGVII